MELGGVVGVRRGCYGAVDVLGAAEERSVV